MKPALITFTQRFSIEDDRENSFFQKRKVEIVSLIENLIWGGRDAREVRINAALMRELYRDINQNVANRVLSYVQNLDNLKSLTFLEPTLPYVSCEVQLKDFSEANAEFDYILTTSQLTLVETVGEFLVLSLGDATKELSAKENVRTFSIKMRSDLTISSYQSV